MKSSGTRHLIMGGAILALVVWAGITYWPPKASMASGSAGSMDADAGLAALEAALDDTADTPGDNEATSPAAAHSGGPWPTDPFFRSVPEDLTAAEQPTDASPPLPAPAMVYELGAIMAGAQPMALINGRVVGIGDHLANDVVVVAIDSFTVTVREPNGPRVLKLPE